MATPLPQTLGALRASEFTPARLARNVKDELRENLIAKLRNSTLSKDQTKTPLFPGIVGYEDTVIPQLINAILSRHNFILLGLRGQAKSRILRALTTLLDPACPYVAGSEVRDNPYAPISKFSRDLIEKMGDGAFSNVYKARDLEGKAGEVAIKVVRKFEMNSSQVSPGSKASNLILPCEVPLTNACLVV